MKPHLAKFTLHYPGTAHIIMRSIDDRRAVVSNYLVFIQKWWIAVQAKAAAISQPQA
jgi:hypothetical protein